MAQDDLFGAPAGWYPDPLGLPQLRWWNNHSWTEQTSAARQPMVIQDTKFAWADDELPTRREERERERQRDEREPVPTVPPTAATLRELEPPRATAMVEPEPVTVPSAPSAGTDPFATTDLPSQASAAPSFGSLFDTQPAAAQAAPTATATPANPLGDTSFDALFGRPTEPQVAPQVAAQPVAAPVAPAPAAAPAVVRAPVVSTGPAWIIAMIPLFQLVISLLLLTTFGMGSNVMIFIGILTVPYFIVIALAFFDYRALRAGGHAHPAHWGWAALTAPVYLLMRARAVIRESGHGIGPVLVWFALAFLHVASIIAIPGLLISVVPTVFTAQIEQSVAADALLISNTVMTVDCPPTPPVLTGEQITCSSVNSNGKTFDVIVRLERSNGWIAWQVIDWGVFQMGS